MSFFQSLILGVVQGFTEFIPISSTAHLILVPWLLGWKFDPKVAFVFDVLLRLGMLTGLFSRRPFETEKARLGWLIVLATVPAVLIGLAFSLFLSSSGCYDIRV